jgi:hypothetical protein
VSRGDGCGLWNKRYSVFPCESLTATGLQATDPRVSLLALWPTKLPDDVKTAAEAKYAVCRIKTKYKVPATVSAIADAIRWAELILEEIDRRHPTKHVPQETSRDFNRTRGSAS